METTELYRVDVKPNKDDDWATYKQCQTQFSALNSAIAASREGKYSRVVKVMKTDKQIQSFLPYEDM